MVLLKVFEIFASFFNDFLLTIRRCNRQVISWVKIRSDDLILQYSDYHLRKNLGSKSLNLQVGIMQRLLLIFEIQNEDGVLFLRRISCGGRYQD